MTSLRDFFGDESTFIAVGTELVDRNSLELTPQELSLLDKLRKPCGSCVTGAWGCIIRISFSGVEPREVKTKFTVCVVKAFFSGHFKFSFERFLVLAALEK